MSVRAVNLAVIAVTLSLAYGIWYAYSVVLVALLKEYGWSRSVLAGAFSVFTLVHGAVNPAVGALCDRVRPFALTAVGGVLLGLALLADSFISTPLQLYLAFGVATAVGVATAGWIPGLVQVQRDFQDRLGLAVGFLSSGVGIGMLVVVPFTQFLIDSYGWRAAFRVLAAICVLWIVPASLFLLRRPVERRPVAMPKDARPPRPSVTLGQALGGAPFWFLITAFFFGGVSTQMLHVHQVAYLVDQGFTAILAATVVGVVGGASIVGKIGGGWLSDRFEREGVYMVGAGLQVAAVATLAALAGSPALWMTYLYAVLFGMGYAATASLIPSMMSDRYGGAHYGAIVGFGMLGGSVGSALGPWAAGLLFDRTGSYMPAFLTAAACAFGAGAAVWGCRVLRISAPPGRSSARASR